MPFIRLDSIGRVLRSDEPHCPSELIKAICFIWGFEHINPPRIEGPRESVAPAVPVIRPKSDDEVADDLAGVDVLG